MDGLEDSQDDLSADLTTPLLGSRVVGNNNNSPYRPGSAIGVPSTVLEPPNVYRSRWRSIRVMYLTMFLGSVTFTITMSSLWPFLQVLDPEADASFLGWVVASYSLGQLLASPVFGGWATMRKSSREPLTVSLILTTLSNLFYTYLQSIPDERQYYMILARGLIGFGAGNVAVVRSYVSGATTVKERTNSMANVSICQAVGFILGPVIQSALVPVNYPGPVECTGFHLNMYTAPGLLATLVALTNLLLLIFVFKEHHVYDDDVNPHVQSSDSRNGDLSGSSVQDTKSDWDNKPDYVAVFSSIFLFFVVLFIFTVFETIGTPLTMHMYAWSKSRATLYQGIILGVAGFCSIIVFIIVKMLAKKYNERYLLLIGFIFCLSGYIVYIPWGDKLPPLSYAPIGNDSKPNTGSTAIMPSAHPIVSSLSPVGHQLAFEPVEKKQQSSFFKPHMHRRPSVSRLSVSSSDGGMSADVKLDSFNSRNKLDDVSGGIRGLTNSMISMRSSSSSTSPWTTESSTQPNSTPTSNYTTPPHNTISTIGHSRSAHHTTTTSSHTTATTAFTSGSTFSTGWQNFTTEASHNTSQSPEGCPWQYEWCRTVPVINFAQYLVGTLFVSIGYPMCNLLSYTIYSKVLGPQPQGLWMGWLTASGSLARTMGPIYVSQVYDSFGPQVTFGSSGGFILVTIIFYLLIFRRLVPFSFKDKSMKRFGASSNQNSV
ncbi:major facilitator superfamily domain-containing protein 8 [Aplysia californica]|uniref:Major facilitator superfamily domain-containing protein 8 n=1 Tax=Aplysia californica TaxID=6500 RepID=A0ABM1A976_APLCA|nr:major facilitator superfamily domain-containing protein 8 [Aplysia californica]